MGEAMLAADRLAAEFTGALVDPADDQGVRLASPDNVVLGVGKVGKVGTNVCNVIVSAGYQRHLQGSHSQHQEVCPIPQELRHKALGHLLHI